MEKMNAYKEIELDKKTYEFSYSICENPHCNCYGINISLGSNINFFLDFATESVKNDSNNNEIIKFFLDFIKNDNEINLECLKKEYLFVKDLAKGKQNTIQSFSLGEFMVYRDIIWNEDDLNMNYEDKNYVIIDSYCYFLSSLAENFSFPVSSGGFGLLDSANGQMERPFHSLYASDWFWA